MTHLQARKMTITQDVLSLVALTNCPVAQTSITGLEDEQLLQGLQATACVAC